MKKQEFLNILLPELERLENVEHVSDLANAGRYEEVDVIIGEIDYSSLNEYIEGEYEYLDIFDIPEQHVLTFAIYLSGSEYDEMCIMDNWEDLRDVLLECGNAGRALAASMSRDHYLNDFYTFAELVSAGEVDEESEE